MIEDQRGYILGLVMVFFVVFSIMGLTFMEMGKFESIAGSNNYDKLKALYNAEAGIHKGLWLANKVSKAAATFSDATVSVVYDSVNHKMTATGQSGSITDSIRVTTSSGTITVSSWDDL